VLAPSFQGCLGFFLGSDRIHTKDLTHSQQSGLYGVFCWVLQIRLSEEGENEKKLAWVASETRNDALLAVALLGHV
jgi:hypothetical protein